MKRLVVIVLILAVVLVVAALQVRREPEVAGPRDQLSPAQQQRLRAAEERFAKEKGTLLRLRKSGATAAELAAQEKKAGEAADALMAVGGIDAVQSVGRRGRAARLGGARGRMGRGGRGRRGAMREGAPAGAKPGAGGAR